MIQLVAAIILKTIKEQQKQLTSGLVLVSQTGLVIMS